MNVSEQKLVSLWEKLGNFHCFEQKEHFICLFLHTKNRLIFKEVISIGSLNTAIVHPREVSMQR
uniref:JAB domain-containing protein n=1 Tax=Paenibacillus sp. FSL H3-0469 TaxID=2954506 RepID=UPI004048ACD9